MCCLKHFFTYLYNFRYLQRARYLSNIFRDDTQTPIEKAVSSIEYVLRHKGAPFLRSPAVDMPVYQQALLDVVAGLLAITILFFIIIGWFLKKIVGLFTRPKININKKHN